jgi:serine/threonine protein kinase/Tol biopolymer transport system component
MTVGDRIGPYQVTALLGEGGMGTVFRARDTRLNRDVAIKVVSDAFAADPERLARFTREAQTLAALSHPNIAAIYGIEGVGSVWPTGQTRPPDTSVWPTGQTRPPDESPAGPVRALVMELVEGDDLSTVIAREKLPLSDTIRIAKQIADALEAAHEQGIVHRDLKPANIKVRPDGSIKVLDFGLAKALAPDGAGAAAGGASNSPTLTARATAMGMILGTAAYMAPEQARGKPVDRRADIWAFGVVLFEMLIGERLFKGDETTDVLAAVLRQDVDWTQLPPEVSPAVRRLLRRCLEKDPRKRLSSIADARLELDEPDTDVARTGVARTGLGSEPHRSHRSWLSMLWPALAAALVTAGVMIAVHSVPPSPFTGTTRTSILGPVGQGVYPDSTMVVISPDGTKVAFCIGSFADRAAASIWVRPIDSLTATRIEGTEGGFLPFWKPDSARIGFFSGRKLKVVSLNGGHAESIADAAFGRGATWSPTDVIVFAGDADGTLSRVSANGGEATRITTLNATRKESSHRFPVFLPDGDHFLYAALPGHDGKFNILTSSVSNPANVTLVAAMGNTPVFAAGSGPADPGWLLFGRQGVLAAQPFDPKTLKTTGEAVSLADEPSVILDPQVSYTAGHMTSVSSTGAMAYFSGASSKTKAVWLDATGTIVATLPIKPDSYSSLRLSPDGTQAVVVKSISASESSLWLVDIARGSTIAFSTGGGRNETPVFSPEGTRVLFSSDRNGPQDFFIKTLADASPEQPLFTSDVLFKTPTSWTGDGTSILFHQVMPTTAYDVYSVPATGKGTPVLVAGGRLREVGAVASPNGQWVAFLSEDTGRLELYVQSFPQAARRLPVSGNSASRCWWTSDGRGLLYVTADMRELWRADLDLAGSAVRVSAPKRVGSLPPGLSVTTIDATPDRQRFLALVPDESGVPSITVVQGWQGSVGKARGK